MSDTKVALNIRLHDLTDAVNSCTKVADILEVNHAVKLMKIERRQILEKLANSFGKVSAMDLQWYAKIESQNKY